MKKGFFRGLTLALALMLACGMALAEVCTTGNVWLRTGPGLSYDTITSFPEGKTLKYLGETSVDDRGVAWYKVSSGKVTGWISSRYSRLVGEEAAPARTVAPTAIPTPRPTAVPTAEPTATPQPTQPPVSLPAPGSGLLFSSSDVGNGDGAEDGQAVELSGYYLGNLVDSANTIGLISYRQVESEAPYQYYNDAVILAGNQLVENIVVYGSGYEVYGVSVGMGLAAARACLNAAGLDYVASMNGATYEHRATDSSLFTDDGGHDSCINLWVDEDDKVVEIDWSTYTG